MASYGNLSHCGGSDHARSDSQARHGRRNGPFQHSDADSFRQHPQLIFSGRTAATYKSQHAVSFVLIATRARHARLVAGLGPLLATPHTSTPPQRTPQMCHQCMYVALRIHRGYSALPIIKTRK
jgi:hypothetical protein